LWIGIEILQSINEPGTKQAFTLFKREIRKMENSKKQFIRADYDNSFEGTILKDNKEKTWVIKKIIKPSNVPAKWFYILECFETRQIIKFHIHKFTRCFRIA